APPLAVPAWICAELMAVAGKVFTVRVYVTELPLMVKTAVAAALDVTAGTSFAPRRVALNFVCTPEPVVLLLHAIPASATASTPCNLDVRIASPFFPRE